MTANSASAPLRALGTKRKKIAASPLTGRPTQAQSAHIDERLQEAALNIFLSSGFEGATMEAIARAAGITKRTLYARYSDKNALFADVAVWATTLYHAPELPQEISEWDLAKGLTTIAQFTLRRALDPDVVRLNKLAIMESARISDFSTRAYSSTWSPRVKAVADLLAKHLKAGDIYVEDVEVAAELFIAMVAQRPAWMALMGATRPAEQEDSHIRQATEIFLRAIQPSTELKKPSKLKAKLKSTNKRVG